MLKLKIFSHYLFLVGLVFMASCAKKVTISEIKNSSFTPQNNNPFGSDYEIKGYVIADPVPYLVEDPYWMGINKPVPDNAFIRLVGSNKFKLGVKPETFEGRLVRIRGNVKTVSPPGDNSEEVVFESNSIDAIPGAAPCCSTGGRRYIPICSLNSPICVPHPSPNPRRFALLYSGGYNWEKASWRYWNDLAFMYHVLRSKYGFPEENIIVVYKDGQVESAATDSNMPVHYKADAIDLEAAFNALAAKIGTPPNGNNDLVFIFTTNHGGQEDDDNGDEDDDPPGKDEVLYYYDQSPTGLRDDDFRRLLDRIPANVKTVGLYEQCHSGGMIKDCATRSNLIQIAAAGEDEDSYGLCTIQPCMRYDAFSYFFTAALYGKFHDGTAFASTDSPDTDNDNKVSILEAYWYATKKDTACCTHGKPAHLLNDDNNDQASEISQPSNGSKPPVGQDGFLSSQTFLN